MGILRKDSGGDIFFAAEFKRPAAALRPTDLQYIAERELRDGLYAARADAGTAGGASPPVRDADQLDLTDVLGAQVVDTAHLGRVTIRPESAAGALEVMSRFALHPRWLPYLHRWP